MKGVILAGGNGTRLRPLTYIANKHLLPVYDKPMILFPLETLKSFGITDILIVSGGEHIGAFAEFLEDGSKFGVSLTYRVQPEAGGIAEALGLARDFFANERVVAILGDNIYDNDTLALPKDLKDDEAVLFGKEIPDPERFGVMEFDNDGKIAGIEEKPEKPKSTVAVTGLYVYPNDVFDVIPTLKPSARGELEITDVNEYYVQKKKCRVVQLDGFWSDAGLFSTLHESADWVKNNAEKQ